MSRAYGRIPTRFNPNKIPQIVEIQNGNILQAYETNDVDKVSSLFLYNGLEDRDGSWVIETVDSSSGVSLRYATQMNNPTYTNYTDAWANRATLTYGLFSTAF